MSSLFNQPFAIIESRLQSLMAIKVLSVLPQAAANPDSTVPIKDGKIGIIEIDGPIFGKLSCFESFFYGGQSVGYISSAIDSFLADNSVKEIVYRYGNAPGGQVEGIQALTEKIKEAAKIKPSTAYVNGTLASAHFWTASPLKIYAAETAFIGSVGVVFSMWKKDDNKIEIVSSNAEFKRPDLETEAGVKSIKVGIDKLAAIMDRDIAANRNTTVEKVNSDFGKGGELIAPDALKAGMIDGITNWDKFILMKKEDVVMTYVEWLADKANQDFLAQYKKSVEAVGLADSVKAADIRVSAVAEAFKMFLQPDAIAKAETFIAQGFTADQLKAVAAVMPTIGPDKEKKTNKVADSGFKVENQSTNEKLLQALINKTGAGNILTGTEKVEPGKWMDMVEKHAATNKITFEEASNEIEAIHPGLQESYYKQQMNQGKGA